MMQAGHTSRRAVMSLFHRGINLSNQNIKMFSKMATPTRGRTLLNSSVVKQMECTSQLSSGRQLFLRRDLPTLQIGSRMFCDKTNRVVEVDGKTSKDPEKVQKEVQKVASSPQHEHFSARSASNFDKRLLVYFGKYKTTDEVPELVSVHLLNSTRNKFRIYVNIFIALLTVFASGIMIYRGHRDSGQGDTLSDHNMRRHPQHYKKQEQTD